jgi:bacterioferritin (cytochrome b1)
MMNKKNNKEYNAMHKLNLALKLSRNVYNKSTVDLLISILKMEENHINWTEIQRVQIDQ